MSFVCFGLRSTSLWVIVVGSSSGTVLVASWMNGFYDVVTFVVVFINVVVPCFHFGRPSVRLI